MTRIRGSTNPSGHGIVEMGCGCKHNNGEANMRKNNNNTSRSRSFGTAKIRSVIAGSRGKVSAGLRAENDTGGIGGTAPSKR